jgi:hypothetical protein
MKFSQCQSQYVCTCISVYVNTSNVIYSYLSYVMNYTKIRFERKRKKGIRVFGFGRYAVWFGSRNGF